MDRPNRYTLANGDVVVDSLGVRGTRARRDAANPLRKVQICPLPRWALPPAEVSP